MLHCVAYFSNAFAQEPDVTVLMGKSLLEHALLTALSIELCYIFFIYEQKWETRQHIHDHRKYSWCILQQNKKWIYNFEAPQHAA